jgi:uncharacterized protein YcfL
MNRVLLITTSLCIALAVGCAADRSPSPGMGDPYPAPMHDPQISVLSPDLRPWLGFQPAVVIDDGERPMSVEVPVRNLSERQYLIDYRILFYDANGSEISPVMGWEMAVLEPKQVVRLKRRALDLDAVAYRLEVRWAR